MEQNDQPTLSNSTVMPSQGIRRRTPRRAVRLAGFLLGFVLVVSLAALGGWMATVWRTGHSAAKVEVHPWSRPVVSPDGLVDRSGIQIVYVAVTGDGGLVDLRFKVFDPDKAVAIHDPETPPAVVDAATGVVAKDLFMGHSHTSPFHAGQTYYLIFENPGNLVQRGGKVSVLLGNAEVDNVEVK